MKILKSLLFVALAAMLWIACQKENSGKTTTETKLVAAKSEIKAGETVSLSIQNPVQGAVARWAVTPAAGVSMDSVYSRNQNTITFSQSGNYTINAELRLVHPNCMPSPGWDTCYNSGTSSGKISSAIKVSN